MHIKDLSIARNYLSARLSELNSCGLEGVTTARVLANEIEHINRLVVRDTEKRERERDICIQQLTKIRDDSSCTIKEREEAASMLWWMYNTAPISRPAETEKVLNERND